MLHEKVYLLILSAWSYKWACSPLAGVWEKYLWEVTTVHHWLYANIHSLLNSIKGHWWHYMRDEETEGSPSISAHDYPCDRERHVTMSITSDREHHIWPWASRFTSRCLLFPDHQNLQPLPEDSYDWHLLHTALQLRPYPTHHQHVCHNFSYSLKSRKPGAAGQPDTQPTNSCSGPQEARGVLLLNFAWKRVGKSLLTRVFC